MPLVSMATPVFNMIKISESGLLQQSWMSQSIALVTPNLVDATNLLCTQHVSARVILL